MMDILVHTCCAPCLTYTQKRLEETGQITTVFYYNPNIHPYQEYQHRLKTLKQYTELKEIELISPEHLRIEEYPLSEYLENSLKARENRCTYCYTCRLRQTAEIAVEHGFDAYTTTLLISPYQKHSLIRQLGEEIGRKTGVQFYYEDFRTGYRESREISRSLNLYMQKYCGCIFSETERYRDKDRAKIKLHRKKRIKEKVE